jgi:hypothetical protein
MDATRQRQQSLLQWRGAILPSRGGMPDPSSRMMRRTKICAAICAAQQKHRSAAPRRMRKEIATPIYCRYWPEFDKRACV